MKLIALCGAPGAGKTEAQNYLHEQYGVRPVEHHLKSEPKNWPAYKKLSYQDDVIKPVADMYMVGAVSFWLAIFPGL